MPGQDESLVLAARVDALANIGLGRVAYLRSFDHVGLAQLIPGAVTEPDDVTFILFGANGELLSFHHHADAGMIDAAEKNLAIAMVH
jgi:hypothetical protein